MIFPKIGMRFVHARWLDEHNRPAACTVSAIRQGVVYYKVGDERKARQCVEIERWPSIVRATL